MTSGDAGGWGVLDRGYLGSIAAGCCEAGRGV